MKGGHKKKFSEAMSFCKADHAWLVMPKSTDDIDDIADYDSENEIFLIDNINNHNKALKKLCLKSLNQLF